MLPEKETRLFCILTHLQQDNHMETGEKVLVGFSLFRITFLPKKFPLFDLLYSFFSVMFLTDLCYNRRNIRYFFVNVNLSAPLFFYLVAACFFLFNDNLLN